MSKRPRSKQRKIQRRIKRIDSSEIERLGSSSVVNTYNFSQRQSFGAASSVRHISPEEYKGMINEQMD